MRTRLVAKVRRLAEDGGMSAMPLEEINKLPVEERLRLVEEIWESIRSDSEAVPLTPEQRDELERRLAAHRADPTAGDDLATVLERIRARG
jgi:putative addiction module component (TIGR02574 family)